MKNYKFIEIEGENETEYLVVSESSITTIPCSSCRDQYGQVVGYEVAGDWAEILTQEGADIANKTYNEVQEWDDETEPIEKYSVGDCVSAYDFYDVFMALIDSNNSNFKFEQQMVDVIEYHDGHNFQTFTLEGEGADGVLVEDEDLISELNEAIENMSFVSESTGIKHYESEGFYIDESAWQGSFDRYSMRRK